VPAPASFCLRDAQRAIAQQYGFDSWDALRTHVEAVSGPSHRTKRKLKEMLDYDDPVPSVVELNSLSRQTSRHQSARRLTTRECCHECCASVCERHMWTRGCS
jgi:hypothetical protein